MRRKSLLGALLLAAACLPGKSAENAGPDPGIYAKVAAAALAAPCQNVPEAGPVPTMPNPPPKPDPSRAEVAVYLSHPQDDAFFVGGTLTLLGKSGHHVSVMLLTHGEGGRLKGVDEHGVPLDDKPASPEKVAAARDEEEKAAAQLMKIDIGNLYPAAANLDFGKTLDCAESYARWNKALPDGLANVLQRLVADIRAKKPRVVIANDPRHDPSYMEHGHDKALGALTEIAARMAANPAVPGDPWVVEEFLAVAPLGSQADVSIPADPHMRHHALSAYTSQFRYDKLQEELGRGTEDFVVRWRAAGVAVPQGGSILVDILQHAVGEGGEGPPPGAPEEGQPPGEGPPGGAEQGAPPEAPPAAPPGKKGGKPKSRGSSGK